MKSSQYATALLMITAIVAAVILAAAPIVTAQQRPSGDRQVESDQPPPATEGETPSAAPTPEGEGGEGAEQAPEPNQAAVVLSEVAARLGLVGSISQQNAKELAAQYQQQSQGQILPTGVAAPLPLYMQYAFVGVAEGQFETEGEQTLSAALYQFESGEEAWGYWSRIRQGDAVRVAQEARFDGQKLRFWQGPFCGELALEPPNERADEQHLTDIARALASRIGARGQQPRMINALPTRALVEDSIIYFHSGGTASDEALSLSDETDGLAARYEVRENTQLLMLVRYPSQQAAQAAWRVFVGGHLAVEPGTATAGGMRFGYLPGEGWSGVTTRGRYCAFVIGAVTKDELRIMLAQAIARAS